MYVIPHSHCCKHYYSSSLLIIYIITYLSSLPPQYNPIHCCLQNIQIRIKVDYSTVYSHIFAGLLIYIDKYMRQCEVPICAQYSILYHSCSQYIILSYNILTIMIILHYYSIPHNIYKHTIISLPLHVLCCLHSHYCYSHSHTIAYRIMIIEVYKSQI